MEIAKVDLLLQSFDWLTATLHLWYDYLFGVT